MQFGKNKVKVFDIEAKDWVNFYLGKIYDGETILTFNTLDALFNYMINDADTIYYAHNAGKYDCLFFIEYAEKINYTDIRPYRLPKGSKIIRLDMGKCIIFDSLNLLPKSLAVLSEIYTGIKGEKYIDGRTGEMIRKLKFDYSKIGIKKYDKELNKYADNDVKLLYELLEKFNTSVEKNYDCHIGITLASLAYKIFKKNFRDKKRDLITRNNEFVRQAYFGGRCEIFKFLGKNIRYYDINSCYPFVMQKSLPIGIACFESRHKNALRIIMKTEYLGFADITIRAKYMYIPVLPHKGKKLIFPCGTFRGTYTLTEIRYALNTGNYEILNIHDMMYYKNSYPVLAEFANDIYKERMAGNEYEKLIYKNIGNSLYGKFAELPLKTKYARITSKEPLDYIGWLPWNGNYYTKDVLEYDDSRVAWSAYITSYARLELLKYLNDKTLYCDTDGIFTEDNFDKFCGTKLGQLKLEGKFDNCHFILPKIYTAKNKKETLRKAKGFGKIETDERFNRLIEKEQIDYEHLLCFAEMVKQERVKMERVLRSKQILSEYDKRLIIGNDTIPLFLNTFIYNNG